MGILNNVLFLVKKILSNINRVKIHYPYRAKASTTFMWI